MTSQRFPHPREDHLDADEKRAAASKGYALGKTGKRYPPGGLNMTSGEWKLLVVVVLVACAVRLFRLSKPNSVVFDEVHFGKFVSRYIKTWYFVDMHPPPTKLLITLTAFVFGYDGNFDFETIGKIYEHVPYIAMHMVLALLSIATVPLAYLTLHALDCHATTALLASIFITSAHPDQLAPCLLYRAHHLSLVQLLQRGQARPVLAGLVDVACAEWAEPRRGAVEFAGRFEGVAEVIHFLILENSGEGDGFMSPEFQHTLGGKGMQDTYADVAVGSTITIRHINTQGGYLHSHPHNYPEQQITLYPHIDDNNNWLIVNASLDGDPTFDYTTAPLQPIHPHMRIKLQQ
ncbi:hypothetical protein CVT26_004626 [Gymnopilus dilepis]|uniref:dolichyl-phosphate-mannose--protein mannosyltransferase n=1 Tax=Gymnopilus dilepis TaxID=231916 RepID=A0A409YTM3_9AGAR|nr:hypothetical protein CVT26_004626 [Gymnopilus dilepis]